MNNFMAINLSIRGNFFKKQPPKIDTRRNFKNINGTIFIKCIEFITKETFLQRKLGWDEFLGDLH